MCRPAWARARIEALRSEAPEAPEGPEEQVRDGAAGEERGTSAPPDPPRLPEPGGVLAAGG
ncbi:hypothetical protein ACIGW0_08485 [Streptomyces bikiniensis]|uniref:Uncharacterized protein n=1 Tax=Streptomyces bikiniensis TaxID=1896 RepID=A0ABW8CSD6_STRBI